MSLYSRILNVLLGDRLSREIDEELQSHLEEAAAEGRDPAEARRAFGSMLRQHEQSRDVRLVVWLDSLRADAVFGWRQLKKRKTTSAAAILSLALAIGACTSAFRLIDALLLRPLPIAAPDRLYALAYEYAGDEGKRVTGDRFTYPLFRQMRAAVKGQAELLAATRPDRIDLTFGSDEETEKAHLQHVSGWTFGTLGLRPAWGRLLNESDDLEPGAHPYAVLSYDYWTRRFGRDPQIVGRSFRYGRDLYQIVGVAEGPFTGTEPGTVTDIFVPMMMKAEAISRNDYYWMGILARLGRDVQAKPVRDRLQPLYRASREERAKGFTTMSRRRLDQFVNQTLLLEPAAAGASGIQNYYRRSLSAVGVLVALVLLIACANVANLMTAQAAARAREMALRVSIGAGRWRLVQMVLVESAWIAMLAAAIGGVFAWWSAPLVVGMINPPDNPARLFLPWDWRVLGFGLSLTAGVVILFGLTPALRASAVKPASALKGGDDPHSRGRLMYGMIAAQVAFCFIVLFVGGLLIATFVRLSHQPIGFSSERLLTVTAVTDQPQPAALWEQVAEHLRVLPGVQTAAITEWPLMAGGTWNGLISLHGEVPTDALCNFMNVSAGWIDAMKIPLLEGRDFRPGESTPASALVNHAFAKQFFPGEDPVGKTFYRDQRTRFQIVGMVGDARYEHIRNGFEPAAYFLFQGSFAHATFLVRGSARDPLALSSTMRQEVPRARPGFRVSEILTQEELVQAQTVRERLIAMLAIFFDAVALLLSGIGLYGVLDYSVVQRRREIGLRIALGAQPGRIAGNVTMQVFRMVLTGAVTGLTLGVVSARYIQSLLYQVRATDLAMLALPTVAVIAAAFLAALPAVIRATRVDPVTALRAE